jgi:hypothetical protein
MRLPDTSRRRRRALVELRPPTRKAFAYRATTPARTICATLDALEATPAARRYLADIIGGDGVRRCGEGQSRNETLRALKQALRRLQFPQLAATEVRLRALVKNLGLPTGVTVTLPQNLEGDELVVTVRASSTPELRRRLARAVDAFGGGDVEELYRVLGGEW